MQAFLSIPCLVLPWLVLFAGPVLFAGESSPLLEALSKPEDQWASTFDSTRKEPAGVRGMSVLLARSLDDSAEIYRNRDGDQVDRLKTSLLMLLADTSEFDQEAVAPRVREILKFTTNPRLYAAAAKVAGRCTTARDLRSPLTRSLMERWGGDRVNLGSYYPCCGDDSAATTPRQEAACALLALGSLKEEESALLKHLATDPTRQATPQDIPSLARSEAAKPAKPALYWIPPEARKSPFPEDLRIETPHAPPTVIGATKGKPAIVVFVFTRCHNPKKCSASAFRIAALQQALKTAGHSNPPRIIVGTYDPAHDDTEALAAYFRERDAAAQELLYIKADVEKTKSLLGALEAMASFNGDDVSSHSAELFLLDSANRLAGTFRRGEWSTPGVIEALRRIGDGR